MAQIPIFPGGWTSHRSRIQPLLPEVQRYIKEGFWPQSTSSTAEFSSYFDYFQWTISILSWPDVTIDSSQLAIQNYEDIVKISKCLEQHINCSRIEIADKLRGDFPLSTEAQILRSMDLTIRLWMTLHVRSEDFPLGPSLSDITEIPWLEKASLKTLIQETFPKIPTTISSQGSHIDPSFTAKSLRKICRIKIKWTANLKDHLRYDSFTSSLWLFPHKICLINHLETCNVLPKDFMLETLRTLDLLFPLGKQSTQRYLDESGQTFYRLSSRNTLRASNFDEFVYWRKQLEDLHDVFHRAPKSMPQMWYDRRNPVQWWTFWLAGVIAILTIVFGVIASYTGFKQVALADKAYRFAVLQACSQDNAPDLCRN